MGPAAPGYCPFDVVRRTADLDLESSQVPSAFGTLHVVTQLRSDAPLTILIHGIGGTWSSWTPLIQAARASGVDLGSLLLLDLPGFGASENNLETLDSAVVGAALLAVADRYSAAPVRLIGQSMGAFLALDIAARWPERVSHVTALAGSFRTILAVGEHPLRFARQHPKGTAANVSIFAAQKLGRPGRAAAKMLRSAGARTLFDEIVAHPEELRDSVRSSLAGGFTAKNMRYAARNARRAGGQTPWTGIAAQSSFVWGELDPLVPPVEQNFIAEILPDSARTVVQDAAHILHIERPYDIVRALAL